MLEAGIMVAAFVVKENCVPEVAVGSSRNAIQADELAAAMVDNAINWSGSGTVQIVELRTRVKSS